MAAIIETRSLHKHFGKTVAVDSVDLNVDKNAIFGLVGPDGAGKTTLIRLLVTAMRAQKGEGSVRGYDIRAQADEIKKHIGYLSQEFSLYRDLSVIENIHFFRDIHKVAPKEAEDRIERLLHFARLTEFVDRPAGKLSGGMKQKLGLCCALIHTPDILFLDEPTTGVDPISRRELWSLLYDLWKDGITIVISTPYMDEAERCTDLAFMQKGAVIAHGRPGDLIEEFPYQIARVTSPKARSMVESMREIGGAERVHQHGEVVMVLTDDYSSVEEEISKRAREFDEEADIRQVRPNLEDVFLHFEEKNR